VFSAEDNDVDKRIEELI